MEHFGRALATALISSRKSQKTVAENLGISTSTLSEWKTGRSEPDRPRVTFALEKELGVPAGELSVHLGYLPPDAAASWERALGLDPEIDDRLRAAIIDIVRHMKAPD